MEISVMIDGLKNETEKIAAVLQRKNDEAEALRNRLGPLEHEIRELTEQYDAMKMAMDALGLVHKSIDIADEPLPVEKKNMRGVGYSKLPRRIGKFDPQGKKLGEYPSINAAAKDLGWSTTSFRKYVEHTSKDKQVRIRGYYMEFMTA